MAKPNKTKIREAVLANRGGHENTPDAGIMTIWNSLDPETQKQYLESVEERTATKTQKHQEKQPKDSVSPQGAPGA
jgi:hypothetical protein